MNTINATEPVSSRHARLAPFPPTLNRGQEPLRRRAIHRGISSGQARLIFR